MAKAINDGTCQICGSRQRLPNGRLAKHGYTTRWGFFSGTCTGSEELPFEQSIGLILNAIERAKAEAAGLRKSATEQRAKGSEPESRRTMHSVYQPATWKDRQSRYYWQEVEVLSEQRGEFESLYAMVETRDQGGNKVQKREEFRIYGDGKLAKIVKAGRENYASHLEAEAARYDQYVSWQEERIAGWQPAPLLERLGGR